MTAMTPMTIAAKSKPQGLHALARQWRALEARINQLQNDTLSQRAPKGWRTVWLEEADTLVAEQYALIAQAAATPAAHAAAIATKVALLEAFATAHKPDFAELAGTRLDLIGSIAKDLRRLAAVR